MDSLRGVADAALELTVVGSWSRSGIALRRRLWARDEASAVAGSLAGRQMVVTGGTRGIGRATATALAAAGATVAVVGRDVHRTGEAAAGIARDAATRCDDVGATQSAPGEVWAAVGDLGSVAEVEALVEQVGERVVRLDALVHSAGLLSRSYRASPDGTELTAAVHVVGPHLLTARLAPLLAAGAPSRVVWVSSGGMYTQRLDVAQLEMRPERYRGAVTYARAKRAQVALAHEWSARLAGAGVACVAMHPGWVDTGALRDGLPRFARTVGPLLRTPAEGADTVAWLASGAAGSSPEVAFWLDRLPRREHRWPGTTTASGEQARLWAWCESKAGGAGTAGVVSALAVEAVRRDDAFEREQAG